MADKAQWFLVTRLWNKSNKMKTLNGLASQSFFPTFAIL
jgi:hypothetical protein